MSAQWNMIRESLEHHLRSQAAAREFVRAQDAAEALGGFRSPAVVVEFLASDAGSFEARDAVVTSLVRLAQSRREQRLAYALLWLGLWRPLSRVYQRRRRWFDSPAELASSLSAIFHDQLGRMDFARVQSAIPTLLRNTERDLVRERLRLWRKREREVASDLDAHTSVGNPYVQQTEENAAVDGRRAWTSLRLRPEHDLVVAVVIGGEPASEAGIVLGLSHEAARKRVQRSLHRLRQELEGGDRSAPHLVPSPRASRHLSTGS